ncbi:MAG: hypothetical protein JW395_1968 [Nitrospira sp.]|nr:hypothetical protein [Nitrospira sp.]
MATLRLFSVLIAAFAVSACGTPGGTVAVVGVGNVTRNNAHTLGATVVAVSVPRHSPSSGRSALSSISPATVRVLPFNDDRRDLDAEGQASAAFGVPMGRIRFEPSPATLLGQAIVSEIKSAGHTVTDDAEGAQVTGTVLEFEAHTATTLLYWDVIGNLSVSLQISVARGTNPEAPLAYRARCLDRTYVWPSEAVIAGVMSKCVNDFATQLRTDSRVADALQNLATKEMTARGKVDEVRREIAEKPRAATERSYTNPDQRWSVSYPGDWKLDDNDRFVKISRGQAILGIHNLSNATGTSLDEVADSAIKEWEQQMQKVNVVKRVSRQRATLAGDLTAIAIVHHIGAGQVGKSQKIIVAVKDRRYLIDAETLLASWPDYERDFHQIIGSFRVLK